MESLIAEVRAVLDDAHDTEVHRLMQQHFHDTGANDRLSAREILRATAFMLHSVRNRGERLSARRALILLVLGGWNQTLAENLFEQMGEGNERAVLEQNGVHDQEQEEMEGESDEDVNSVG